MKIDIFIYPDEEEVNYMQTGDYHCLTCHNTYNPNEVRCKCIGNQTKPCTEKCGKWFQPHTTTEEEKSPISTQEMSKLQSLVRKNMEIEGIVPPDPVIARWRELVEVSCTNEETALLMILTEARTEVLDTIAQSEGWEDSRDYYAKILGLPTIYKK